jgi:hypothetical protein
LRAAVLETDTLLKSASPVDLGRFRASWQVGENAAASAGKKPLAHLVNGSQLARASQGLQQERVGNVYSVHNNLPYAEKLATGAAGSG